jgi:hypothetical protein
LLRRSVAKYSINGPPVLHLGEDVGKPRDNLKATVKVLEQRLKAIDAAIPPMIGAAA